MITNFLKGIFGGIGNIVPGLSGSALLVIFGIYQDCLTAITEIVKFKNLKKNILYLIPIALGIAIGTVLFGNIMLFFLEKWPMPTSYAFFGFIVGTIPMLFKEANKEGFDKKFIFPLIITLGIGIVLIILKNAEILQMSNINFLQGIILGIVLASSTIIPGISSTVLLTMIGMYEVYLIAIAKLDIMTLIPVGIGFVFGAVIFAMLINFLLKKCYGYTYYAITGFVIATIPAVIRGNIEFNLQSLLSILIALITFFITYYLGNKRKDSK